MKPVQKNAICNNFPFSFLLASSEAPTRLSYALVPAFVKRCAGAIINIASIVATAPERLNSI